MRTGSDTPESTWATELAGVAVIAARYDATTCDGQPFEGDPTWDGIIR